MDNDLERVKLKAAVKVQFHYLGWCMVAVVDHRLYGSTHQLKQGTNDNIWSVGVLAAEDQRGQLLDLGTGQFLREPRRLRLWGIAHSHAHTCSPLGNECKGGRVKKSLLTIFPYYLVPTMESPTLKIQRSKYTLIIMDAHAPSYTTRIRSTNGKESDTHFR